MRIEKKSLGEISPRLFFLFCLFGAADIGVFRVLGFAVSQLIPAVFGSLNGGVGCVVFAAVFLIFLTHRSSILFVED
jgi:hypothetical protein